MTQISESLETMTFDMCVKSRRFVDSLEYDDNRSVVNGQFGNDH